MMEAILNLSIEDARRQSRNSNKNNERRQVLGSDGRIKVIGRRKLMHFVRYVKEITE